MCLSLHFNKTSLFNYSLVSTKYIRVELFGYIKWSCYQCYLPVDLLSAGYLVVWLGLIHNLLCSLQHLYHSRPQVAACLIQNLLCSLQHLYHSRPQVAAYRLERKGLMISVYRIITNNINIGIHIIMCLLIQKS